MEMEGLYLQKFTLILIALFSNEKSSLPNRACCCSEHEISQNLKPGRDRRGCQMKTVITQDLSNPISPPAEPPNMSTSAKRPASEVDDSCNPSKRVHTIEKSVSNLLACVENALDRRRNVKEKSFTKWTQGGT
jgi:hypothetical protein